uniref:Uncharacterized protein n=1 Tax=Anguilla anguilla TaxID=7936 RepID=A0A0E9P648_ANGAN
MCPFLVLLNIFSFSDPYLITGFVAMIMLIRLSNRKLIC